MTRWGATAIAAVLCPATAWGHAFGGRYDLPLPLGYYLGAAGLAVLASFAAAWAFLGRHRTGPVEIRIAVPEPLARAVRLFLGALGIALLATVVAAAFFGPVEVTRNFATVLVWVVWWVGFVLASALVVTIWPAVDPFRALAQALRRLFGRRTEYHLPRAAGFLAPLGVLMLVWIELVSDASEDPRVLGVLIVLYAGISVAMALIFGRCWFRLADPLGRLFELIGRLAMIRPVPGGLAIGPPGEGLLGSASPRPGEVLLVCVLIGAVLFDGLSEVPAWAAVLDFVSGSQSLRATLLFLRGHGVDLLKMLQTMGLMTVIALTIAIYYLLAWAMSFAAGRIVGTRSAAAAFASSLLPIAAAYHLAHYLSYLLIAGQLALPAASDPFGLGWDVFGTAGHSLNIGVIGTRQVWWIAFVALIAGHSLSVLTGHRRALILFGDPRAASRSQIPMTIAMIGLTVLSLWILSQPITE